MRKGFSTKVVVLFGVVLSLLTVPGPATTTLHIPYVQLGRALPQLCDTQNPPNSCSEYWYPAGPAMDVYSATVFSGVESEYLNLESASPSIDFSDAPVSAVDLGMYQTSSNFRVTHQVETGVGEIEFNMANNFWGCQFYFGVQNPSGFPSNCGIDIRQGIAHLIDKTLFVTNEPSLHGLAYAIDNPLPLSNGGLPQPNPCAWDTFHPETGSQCKVGAVGGTAYHLAPATGNVFPWQPNYGSQDFCAAADHFIAASLATGKDTNCVLTGIAPYVTSHPVDLFIRNDVPILLHLGQSLAEEICALFGQGFQVYCTPYLPVTSGPLGTFPGYNTSNTQVTPSWGIYTAGAGFGSHFSNPFEDVLEHLAETISADPFDSSLYWVYSSRFVSGVSGWDSGTCSLAASNAGICPQGATLPCSSSAIPSVSSPDYMYVCDPSYDSLDNQMEFAPCVSASGDPAFGQSTPTFANCPGTSQLTGLSAGYKTEDLFGQRVYSIPVYSLNVQNVYLNNGWIRVINADGAGSNNFFTALNAWTPTPALVAQGSGVLRQGLSQSTRSVNPYIASSAYDFAIIGLIYDNLLSVNPVSNGQAFGGLAISYQSLPNSSLTYAPPAHTATTYRFTLRNDIFFHDGTHVSAFDVAFSYLSLVMSGGFLGAGANLMTGVTILGPQQLDIGLSNPDSNGIFELLALTSLPILPGGYWTNTGQASLWKDRITKCTATGAACYPAQYTLTGTSGMVPSVNCVFSCANFPSTLMIVDPNKADQASYDPLLNGILIGSGPWKCDSLDGTTIGSGCSSTGAMNPPPGGSYVLHRFGKGLLPGSSVSGAYFRSNGNLAAYLWSQDTGDITHDFLNFSVVASCFGTAVTSTGPCAHFQRGIGANGGPISVGLSQVAIVNRFVGLNWISPWNWAASPPVGIGLLPPVLYENSITLNPSNVAGCTTPYPMGGYDC